MKARFTVALTAAFATSAVLTASLFAAGSSSAHEDGKGHILPPTLAEQQQEAANVIAARADEDSNAPKSYARCVDGKAAGTYSCSGVDMMSHLSLKDLGLSFANDMWGWTDPLTKHEYALVGGIEGTVFVDITDAKRPDVVGILPTHSTKGNRVWRDIKVYDGHAYIVSEHDGHGMQVFDLSQLRGVTGDPVTFDETAHYAGVSNAHNLNINTATGYAYLVGTNTCHGGLHMVDLEDDPSDPTFAGCFSDHNYFHDTQCEVYTGPDAEHRGREICFSSAAQYTGEFSPEGIINTVSVVDVTDKQNPVALDRLEYAGDGYSHQGWLTPDQAYFLHNDELDEYFYEGVETTTRIFDMRDLDDIELSATTDNGQTSIGHNLYTKGDRGYASNYTSGLRIFDTSGVAEGELPETGFFDVYPENDNATFEGGTWSNYPYYGQNVVAVTSMDRGLFVLRARGSVG